MLLRVIKEIHVEDGRKVLVGKLAVAEYPNPKETDEIKIHVKFDEDVETFPDLTISKKKI